MERLVNSPLVRECSFAKFPHLLILWSRTENLVLIFLAMAFMADLQGAIFPHIFMNFFLIIGNLTTTSFNWQTNLSHKVRINLPCQPWSSCTKNLESIKCQFLNSSLLFLTPYSNNNYQDLHILCFISYFGFKNLCLKKY